MKRFILSLLICLTVLVGGVNFAFAVDAADKVELVNPIGGTEANPKGTWDLMTIGAKALNYTLGILGGLVFLVFVYGGFLWLTSAGNEENIKKGTQTMLWATIGIFVIFGSYAIIRLIIEALQP